MQRKNKGLLIAAALLVIAGFAICAGVMILFDWDFSMLNTVDYETNVHDISGTFDNISINTDTADITFELSENGECKAVCHEIKELPHSVQVKGDTLEITWTDNRKAKDYIGIAMEETTITFYLPRAEYDLLYIKDTTGDITVPKEFCFENIEICATTGDVECCASAEENFIIETDTGDIKAENVSANDMALSVTTGHITLGNAECGGNIKVSVTTGETAIRGVRCENLAAEGDTGDIMLTDVIATGALSIERTTGDVTFDRCDAAEIFVMTDTGDVGGSLLSEKHYVISTNTGDVEVPRTTGGGKCEIITDTGDIVITEE